MQNIGADNAGDAFYRYKMPKLVAKVEGRGNGIKTNIVNNVDIARALDRPPTYTLKHFGCELGAQTNFDKKTGTSIVNGAHDAKKLSEVLEIFIKKYVQCYSCNNPETVVKIRKECIFLKCKACGHTSDVDMRDKLTTFMLKNPPENKMSKSEEKVKKAEKERVKAAEKEARKAEKADAKEKKKKDRKDGSKKSVKGDEDSNGDGSAEEAGDDDDGDDDGTEWKTDLSADAVAKRAREQLTSAAASLIQAEGTVPVGEFIPASPAIAPASPEAVMEEDDDDDDDLEPAEVIRKHIGARKPPLALAEILASLDIPGGAVGRMKLFFAALMEDCDGRLSEHLKSRDEYIHALARDDKSQAAQLIALEHYLTQVVPARMSEMPFVLKMLYEEDLIDESIIIAWGDAPAIAKKHGVDKASAQEIRKLSAKVLEWLQEESEDEE